MSPSLTLAPAACCGRCNAPIPEGCFCESCRSFFARFAQLRSPAVSSRAELSAAPPVLSPSRPLPPLAPGPQWRQFTLVDQAFSVVVLSNDPMCLTRFLSVAASVSGSRFAGAGEYRYSIEARSGVARDYRYVVWAGSLCLGVAATRVQAIRKLQAHLHCSLVQSSIKGAFVQDKHTSHFHKRSNS